MPETVTDENPMTPDSKNAKAQWSFTVGAGVGDGASKQTFSFNAKENLYDGVKGVLGLTCLNTEKESKAFTQAGGIPLSQSKLVTQGACVKLIAEWQKGRRKGTAKILVPAGKLEEVVVAQNLVGKEFGTGRKITQVRGQMTVSRTI